MIKSLSVRGLNHRVDADLEFNEDLNIITGKNGSGKTTLLKLLWYLISGNLERIVPEILFQMVSIETDSFTLSITQDEPIEGNTRGILVDFEFHGRLERDLRSEPIPLNARTADTLSKLIANSEEASLFFPSFRRIEGGYASRGDFDNFGWNMASSLDSIQDFLKEFSSEISNNDHDFIVSYSTYDVGQLLEKKYRDTHVVISNLQSKILDNISLRIQTSSGEEIESVTAQTASSVLDEIRRLADERDRLLKPFNVLSGLTQSILQYKAIRVVGRDDFGEVSDEITLGEETEGATLEETKEAIASEKLSSGEKQMLSFLCYNAFNENTTIFIDEPELSLHVDWQRLLLPTLLEQGTENQFFIATHSPFIYAKYPDKEILLREDRGDN